ncbi:HNH endonuclease signature motif containing protein [Mycobacterium sp. 663a-19]|uniref:HNH endonuclease n=1 Tax=Mycobacterium sp. 663a-19 TaxID=2986148 RepID=UPI002D1E9E22|nr:HNH endonuclease signature motif containing protein [Mycobacterium sp. 663a-19]MEB3982522.1 HNH endonuclease signature motif containing protein [Mycobacterium sp. 663a-19]
MSERAWLALSKEGEAYRRLVGGATYDDDPASHYSWDSSVSNHATVRAGDVIALWDLTSLLGVSVIESIDVSIGTKSAGRCPDCNRASFEARKTLAPKYRCYSCGSLFDDPVLTPEKVTTYRSNHAESWVDLEGVLDAATLRSLCVSPRSQNSFRPLKVEAFRQAIAANAPSDVLRILDNVEEQVAGGHTKRLVRVRVGQAAFRAKLLDHYGDVCAFTGPAPKAVLDACHLYRYADVGIHKDQGGLLLRKDLHRLFDQGLITVDSEAVLHVAENVRDYPAYAVLHGARMRVKPTAKQRAWLEDHWKQWQDSDA